MSKFPRGNPARWWKSRFVGSAHRSPAAMFISPLRRFATLILLVLLVGLIGGVWYATNPKRISRLAQILLSDVLGADVRVGSGHLSFAGTLELTGVEVRTASGKEQPLTIFSADQVEMRFDWLSLLIGQLRATQITAIAPTAYLVEDRESGRWNYERLNTGAVEAPAGGGGVIATLPVIVLRRAQVQWAQVERGQYKPTSTTVVDAQFSPDSSNPKLYRFRIDPHVGAEPTPAGETGELPAQITGDWDVAANRFLAVANQVPLTDRLRSSMPRQIVQWWNEHKLRGRLSQLKLTFAPQDGLIFAVEFDNVAMMQSVETSRNGVPHAVPIPIDSVRGGMEFGLSASNLKIRSLRGRVFGMAFQAAGEFRGTSAESPFDLTLKFPDADIETYPEILQAYEQAQDFLQRLRPRGRLGATVALKRATWNGNVFVDGTVDLRDVRARFVHFPYPLEKLHGKLTFNNDEVRFHRVEAMADETPIVIDGTCGITSESRGVDLTVSAERGVFDERVAACLAPRFLDVWNAFNPRGTGGFSCHVYRPNEPDAGERISVQITPEDVRGSYAGFPYGVRHLRGKFVIGDEETVIEKLVGKCGPDDAGELEFSGVVKYPKGNLENVAPEIRVIARHVPVDRELLTALPAEHQGWANKVDLTGRLSLDGMLRRGRDKEPVIDATVALADGSVRLHGAAWAIEKVNTQAAVEPGHVAIKQFSGVTGPQGECSLAFSGDVDQRGEALKIQARGAWRGFDVSPKPPAFLPAGLGSLWTAYKPSGLIDGDLDVALELPREGLRGLFPGTAPGPGPATRPATEVASVDPPALAPAELSIIPPTTAPATAPAENVIMPVPGTLRVPATRGWAGAVAATGPAATAPAEIAAAPTTAPAGGPATAPAPLSAQLAALKKIVKTGTIRLRPRSMALAPEGLPGPIEEVQGDVTVKLDRIDIASLSARTGPLTLQTSGFYLPETNLLSLSLQAQSESMPVKWLALAPPNVASFITSLQPQGRLTVDLPQITRQGPADAPVWNVTGDATISKLATEGPIASTVTEVKLSGRGSWDRKAGGLDIDGALTAEKVTFAGKTIDTFHSRMVGSAATKAIALTEVEGKVAGGTLQGGLLVKLDAAPRYEATLTLSDAELASLLLPPTATEEERKRIGTGRVTANLAVQETFGKDGGRTGRGDLVVRDGTIYNVPLAMGLMQLVTLRLPVSKAFNTAQMSYYLRDNKVTFERILLESSGINLAGLGSLSIKERQLDLRFVTESPNEMQLPILTSIFQGARNQLLQLQVSGDIESPKIQPVPLDALSSTLEALLPGRRAKAEDN